MKVNLSKVMVHREETKIYMPIVLFAENQMTIAIFAVRNNR